MQLEEIARLSRAADSKMVLLVLDGLGGLPAAAPGGPTELEAAATPHLDALAARSLCGLQVPVGAGITPGSGPGHLALFGYDPWRYQVGRGVLSALGIDFDLQPGDVAARGNFCTVDADGRVADRRAGRIATELNQELCEQLRGIDIGPVELFVETVEGHRFLLVLRGEGLSAGVEDTDPQEVGVAPRPVRAGDPRAEERTRPAVERFVSGARKRLGDRETANMVLLRGFAQRPDWPTLPDLFGLRSLAIAAYPMYRGVARLVGMEAINAGKSLAAELDALRRRWDDHDFFFVHVKPTDSAGEDGDFERKARVIGEVDALLPELLALGPDVLLVTGDHSTPAAMGRHSWHPVPVMLWSEHCRADRVDRFDERSCMTGGLGARLPASELLPIALANAGRLGKFGA
ncbi:MAG: 2,3-bisphosphoglycerate-independent phosphoglycerate mutase [Candidatus Eiseniibacteriota bacterium]|jgi:2,3-bisphosphoglycerate-independent phosphoglycerate mutase